jgi:hypothetical protein
MLQRVTVSKLKLDSGLQIQANQLIPFYIGRSFFLKIVAMRWAIFKIKEVLAYLSLNLIYYLNLTLKIVFMRMSL